MRDEMDARLWNAHHEAFSNDLAAAGRKASAGFSRLSRAVPMPLKVAATVLAASLAALTAPPPAFAEQARTASVTIAYGDLDLSNSAGRRALERRIEGAARWLCQPDTIGALRERQDRRACYREAVASAEQQTRQALANADARGRAVTLSAR